MGVLPRGPLVLMLADQDPELHAGPAVTRVAALVQVEGALAGLVVDHDPPDHRALLDHFAHDGTFLHIHGGGGA